MTTSDSGLPAGDGLLPYSGERVRLRDVTLADADLLDAWNGAVEPGSYNDFGIHRWFERPRSQLGGRSPKAALKGGFRPDDGDVRRVRALAAALVGGGAT